MSCFVVCAKSSRVQNERLPVTDETHDVCHICMYVYMHACMKIHFDVWKNINLILCKVENGFSRYLVRSRNIEKVPIVPSEACETPRMHHVYGHQVQQVWWDGACANEKSCFMSGSHMRALIALVRVHVLMCASFVGFF